MPDKVQLIKEEIKRRIKNLEFSLENNCVEKYSKLDILGNITTLESLLQFIDSHPDLNKATMTDKEKIRSIIELFIAWNGEIETIDVANLNSAIDFIADSLQKDPIRKGG